LPAGKLRRVAIGKMSQLHHFQQPGDFRFDPGGVRTFTTRQHRQAEGDILKYRHMAEQRIVLEDEAHFTVTGVNAAHVGAMETNMTAGLILQTSNNTQQRGFPEPDGPSSATICPEGISREISFST
jgi:hypothetical protein